MNCDLLQIKGVFAVGNNLKIAIYGRSNLYLDVNPSIHVLWSKYRQVMINDTEACGVLIGGYLTEKKGFSIDSCTSPGPLDIRNRCSFIMRDKCHQKAMNIAYKNSKGTSYLLGTWHTHPEPFPKPSAQDLREWKKLMSQNKADLPSFLFVIVGTKQISFFPYDNNNFCKK